jgi:hypothetical protein
MYQSTLISVLLFCSFGGFAVHRVGFGDTLQYFDRVRPTTVVSAFLGSGNLERRLLALPPGSVGFGCTAQASDSTTSKGYVCFIPSFDDLITHVCHCFTLT